MAVWQYDFEAFPRRSALAVLGEIPKRLALDIFDTNDWWADVAAPEERELASLLPAGTTWSDTIKAWGVESGDRIEIHFSDGRMFALRFRYDLRRMDKQFLRGVIKLAASHEYLFWTEDGAVLEPTLEAVVNDIAQSEAFSFVRNPSEFLDGLG